MEKFDLSLLSNDIVVDINDAHLKITLDRPTKLNALTCAMYEDLTKCFVFASETDSIRAVIINSNSDNFTSGNDIADFLNHPNLDYTHPVVIFLKTLANFNKPLIACVTGAAIGIGTTMLLHCDFVYASEDAYFQMPFTHLGLVPEAGSSYILQLLTNKAVANDLLLLGEKFTAKQALSFGLLNAVDQDPMSVAEKTCHKLCKLPANAVIKTKHLLQAPFRDKIARTIDSELEEFAKCLKSDEAKAAFSSFLSK